MTGVGEAPQDDNVVLRRVLGLDGDERRLPIGCVFVFLKKLVQISHNVVPVFSNREPIETARGSAAVLHVDAVRVET